MWFPCLTIHCTSSKQQHKINHKWTKSSALIFELEVRCKTIKGWSHEDFYWPLKHACYCSGAREFAWVIHLLFL